MYAYVKYVQDNAPNIVPVRLIKNFTLPGVMNKQYLVFWSKDRNQDEAFDRFIKKAKYDERLLVALDDPKREKNLSKFEGYYKAVVLKVSESESDLEDQLSSSDHEDEVGGQESCKAEKPKRVKMVPKRYLTGPDNDTPSVKKKKYKNERKRQTKASSVEATSKILSILNQNEEEIEDPDGNKAKDHISKNSPRSSTTSDKKNEKIVKSVPKTKSSHKSPPPVFSSSSDDEEDDVVPKKELLAMKEAYETCRDDLIQSQRKVEKLEDELAEVRGQQNEKSQLLDEAQERILQLERQVAHPESNEESQGESGLGSDTIRLKHGYRLSFEKWSEIRNVPLGQTGDSKFVGHLALALWGANLRSRMITPHGKKLRTRRNATLVTPKKVRCIVGELKKRIKEEEPETSDADILKRVAKVKKHLGNKIQSLVRPPRQAVSTVANADDENSDSIDNSSKE